MNIVEELILEKKLVVPKWVSKNIHLVVTMGSDAYGACTDFSDVDIHTMVIPPKGYIFPHIMGLVPGFDKDYPKFEQFQNHHIDHRDKEYDVVGFSIIKLFELLMAGNPDKIDFMFVPSRCVRFSTSLGQHVRENRKLFLSKSCWKRYKGYAFSELQKIRSKA